MSADSTLVERKIKPDSDLHLIYQHGFEIGAHDRRSEPRPGGRTSVSLPRLQAQGPRVATSVSAAFRSHVGSTGLSIDLDLGWFGDSKRAGAPPALTYHPCPHLE
ncbi:hypothetical protein RRG08_041040 [Elysia crispata]|uniref:Uncharacterized protein n=1 Tax=Elysia crispata TaxID=231223 RepID=A0AAE1CTU3_9GAST|nr:hypothetical protein RRG08_041040 [Elysia crispata]